MSCTPIYYLSSLYVIIVGLQGTKEKQYSERRERERERDWNTVKWKASQLGAVLGF